MSNIDLKLDVRGIARVGALQYSSNAVVSTVVSEDGTLNGALLAPGSVGSDALGAWSVTTTKVANASIIGTKVAPSNIDSTHLAAGAVTSNAIAFGAVGSNQLAPGIIPPPPDLSGYATLHDAAFTGTTTVQQLLGANGREIVGIDGQINGSNIAPGSLLTAAHSNQSVTSEKLRDWAVSVTKIANNAVIGIKIAPSNVDSTHLAAGAVTSNAIAFGAVGSNQLAPGTIPPPPDLSGYAPLSNGLIIGALLAPGSVTTDTLSNQSVGSNQLMDGAVISSKLGTGAVLENNLQALSVSRTKIKNYTINALLLDSDAVVSEKIAANAVTNPKIAPGAVNSNQLAPNCVLSSNLAPGSVYSDALQPWSVTSTKIANGSVISTKIADSNVITAHLADGCVTADKLGILAVQTANIATKAVTYNKIASNAIWPDNLIDGCVTTAKVLDGAITAAKINSNALAPVAYSGSYTDLINAVHTPSMLLNQECTIAQPGQRIVMSVTEPGSPFHKAHIRPTIDGIFVYASYPSSGQYYPIVEEPEDLTMPEIAAAIEGGFEGSIDVQCTYTAHTFTITFPLTTSLLLEGNLAYILGFSNPLLQGNTTYTSDRVANGGGLLDNGLLGGGDNSGDDLQWQVARLTIRGSVSSGAGGACALTVQQTTDRGATWTSLTPSFAVSSGCCDDGHRTSVSPWFTPLSVSDSPAIAIRVDSCPADADAYRFGAIYLQPRKL